MGEIKEVKVPDIGDFDAVDVIEVLVAPGDEVQEDDSLITLESDKATMDVPSPHAGVVKELKVEPGAQVSQGDVILTLEVGEEPDESDESDRSDKSDRSDRSESDKSDEPEQPEKPPEEPKREPPQRRAEPAAEPAIDEEAFHKAYASPAVRRFARELGVDLGRIEGTGRKGRITREDVQGHVKKALTARPAAGGALPEMPAIDFSKFGEVERQPLSRIRRRAAENLHRSWLHVPHVTQHGEADVTELEAFRKAQSEAAKERGFKLTLLAFLMKAAVRALEEYPQVNSSLAPGGEELILKKYYHLGVAVDTPDGLVVPVIRDVDQKGLFALAGELAEVSSRAREGKLQPKDIQGASFTISSLGGIGGTAFTPIVNAPEVAILGVSRAETRPVWQGDRFEPRLMLPLSFSYDHRVVDGALGARFVVYLSKVLSDIRMLLL